MFTLNGNIFVVNQWTWPLGHNELSHYNSFEGQAPVDENIILGNGMVSSAYKPLFQLYINTLRPKQDGRHFADAIFTCNFFNENCCILITFSLKYFRNGPIDNNPALVQIMAWRRSGDKPLSEPMMISLPRHICVTRPQWVNGLA